jgi:hypothetical protein
VRSRDDEKYRQLSAQSFEQTINQRPKSKLIAFFSLNHIKQFCIVEIFPSSNREKERNNS